MAVVEAVVVADAEDPRHEVACRRYPVAAGVVAVVGVAGVVAIGEHSGARTGEGGPQGTMPVGWPGVLLTSSRSTSAVRAAEQVRPSGKARSLTPRVPHHGE